MGNRQVKLIQLCIIPTIKMMNQQVFIALAFGKPEDRSFKPNDFFMLQPPNTPIRTKSLAGLIPTVRMTQGEC